MQKNAEDVKSGAGQYFTPRPLIQAMVACVRPEPLKTIADPCCGSGGFFLADPANYTLDREQKEFLKNETFYGNELVASTFKLCLMNLYLHNIGDIYGTVIKLPEKSGNPDWLYMESYMKYLPYGDRI